MRLLEPSVNKLPNYLIEVYESDLPIDFIYNSICKLIACCINATNVSLLLYVGKHNSLALAGNYINTLAINDSIQRDVIITEKFKEILENITFYEYLRHTIGNSKKMNKTILRKAHFDEYIKFCCHKNINFEAVNYKDFEKLLNTAENNWDSYNLYINIWKNNIFHLDQNEQGVAKDVYLNFIDNISMSKEIKPVHYKYREISKLNKTYTKILKDKGIVTKFKYDKMIYYPLIYKGRLFGLLRIFTSKKEKIDILSTKNQDIATTINSSISYYIGSQYYLTSLKKINLHETIVNSDTNYNEICIALCEMVNCFGSIIRLKDESGNFIKRGHSKNIHTYINKLDKIGDFYHNKNDVLINLFKKSNNKKKNIIILAYKFTIVKDEFKYKTGNQSIFYREIGNEVVKKTKDIKSIKEESFNLDLNKICATKHLNLLVKNQINEILIFPIYDEQNEEKDNFFGYLTFANTKHRFFFDNDINVLYPLVQRFVLELAYKEKMPLKLLNKMAGNISHSVSSNLANSIDLINEYIANPENTTKEKQTRIKNLFLRLNQSIRELVALNEIKEFTEEKKAYYFKEFIENLVKEQEFILNYNFQKPKNRVEIKCIFHNISENLSVKFNKELLKGILMNLFYNGKKYSFRNSSEIPDGLVLPYNVENDATILECYISKLDNDTISFQIINWGCKIEKKEYSTIFDFGRRTKHGETWARDDGNGWGLHFVKQFTIALKGQISVEHDPIFAKTTFKLILK